jgi:hypothetical protein
MVVPLLNGWVDYFRTPSRDSAVPDMLYIAYTTATQFVGESWTHGGEMITCNGSSPPLPFSGSPAPVIDHARPRCTIS